MGGRDVDDPDDAAWNTAARSETPTDRLDRNWADLLQELRVAQTGVQLLTGLLLTVPFQARFAELGSQQRVLYLITACLSVLATGLLIAPVVLHRVLFRQHARAVLVSVAQRCALAGFATLALAVVGVCAIVFDVVVGTSAAYVAGGVAFVVLAVLWVIGPLALRRRVVRDPPGPDASEPDDR